MNTKETEITGNRPAIDSEILDIESDIASIEANKELYNATNFYLRAEATDLLEVHVTDRIASILERTTPNDKLKWIKSRAEKLKKDFEAIDKTLFQALQSKIRVGALSGTGFARLIQEYVSINIEDDQDKHVAHYDNLDMLVNGLFSGQTMPDQTIKLEPDMVYYQKTPARIIFELVGKAQFVDDDVFFDIGSGLGQTAMLVNLLTGIVVKGIEIEPAFCHYASACACSLNLKNVSFINSDARCANYSEGTIFFMFTPFRGKILEDVLEMLRKEALLRKIKIITYGPCTATVCLQPWLRLETPDNSGGYRLSVFKSL